MLEGFRVRNCVPTVFVGLSRWIAIWEPAGAVATRVGARIYKAYLDNLDRLGLVSFQGNYQNNFDDEYGALNARYRELLMDLSMYTDDPGLVMSDNLSYAELTSFGRLFLQACYPELANP